MNSWIVLCHVSELNTLPFSLEPNSQNEDSGIAAAVVSSGAAKESIERTIPKQYTIVQITATMQQELVLAPLEQFLQEVLVHFLLLELLLVLVLLLVLLEQLRHNRLGRSHCC